MLALSILWVVFAAAVTMIATMKKTPASPPDAGVEARESGRVLTVLAVVYGVVLLAGFVYIGKFLVSGL